MDFTELQLHSFIIKLWLDEISNDTGGSRWHGQITHVPGGERKSFNDLTEITAFVEPYLLAMGVRLSKSHMVRRRVERWLRELMQ